MAEYNNALLVIENANIGWATIQTVQERDYRNLYYSPKSENVDASYFDKYEDTSKMTPGFSMTLRTRPLVISKFQEYVNAKAVTIQSKRLIEEMKVFLWKNGRAEAQSGYNDDLIMSFGIGMYIRDTALKYKQQGIDLLKASLNNITSAKSNYKGGYSYNNMQNPYDMNINGQTESFKWLL